MIDNYDDEFVKVLKNFLNSFKLLVENIEEEKEMKFEELKQNVELWAYDKNLIHSDYRFRQFEKVVEEVYELKEEIIEDNLDNMKLEMGDCLVTLIILSKQLGIDIVDCLEQAYNKIKFRRGKTIDGKFIKEEDLKKFD